MYEGPVSNEAGRLFLLYGLINLILESNKKSLKYKEKFNKIHVK